MASQMARAIPFILEDTYVRQDAQGRFSLNDLHQAAGGDKRHQPSDWLRLEQTQAVIAELSNSGDSRNYEPVSSNAGRYGGTFVVRELVYTYAMWISPAFHVKVVKTFDAVVLGKVAPSNYMNGAVSGMPASRLISLHEHTWALMDRIRREPNPLLRVTYFRQLEAAFGDLGQEAPPLEALRFDSPEPPEVLAFWGAYLALEAAGVKVNHHRQPSLIAINLKQFVQAAAERGHRVVLTPVLKNALRNCRQPRFVDIRTVCSGVLGYSIHCWVFEGPAVAQAQEVAA